MSGFFVVFRGAYLFHHREHRERREHREHREHRKHRKNRSYEKNFLLISCACLCSRSVWYVCLGYKGLATVAKGHICFTTEGTESTEKIGHMKKITLLMPWACLYSWSAWHVWIRLIVPKNRLSRLEVSKKQQGLACVCSKDVINLTYTF